MLLSELGAGPSELGISGDDLRVEVGPAGMVVTDERRDAIKSSSAVALGAARYVEVEDLGGRA